MCSLIAHNLFGVVLHIEYMKYYLDFCKTKSISKTAMRYYMTPQGISRILHQLEDEFGVKLFVRDGNSIIITEAGKALAHYAQLMVDSYDTAQTLLGKFSQPADEFNEAQTVKLVSTTCASTYLIEALKLHKRKMLPFSIRLRETNIYRICSYVDQHSSMLTLGLVSVPLTSAYSNVFDGQMGKFGLDMVSIMCSPLAVMMSSDNPLAEKKSLKRSDISNLPIVCYRDAVLLDALDDYIKEDQVYDITSNSVVLANQLREWHAISFAPRTAQLLEGFENLSMRIVPFEQGEGFFNTRFCLIGKQGDLQDERAQQLVTRINELLVYASNTTDADLFSFCSACPVDH